MKTFIEHRLEELGINPFEAARSAGLERGFINDLLQGKKRTVKGDNMLKLANALQVSLVDLMTSTSETPVPAALLERLSSEDVVNRSTFFLGEDEPNANKPQSISAPKGTMPLFKILEDANDWSKVEPKSLRNLPKPFNILESDGAYALLVYDEKMEPELSPGDIVYIDQNLPPIRNTTCVFSPKGEKDYRICIGRLIDITPDEWILKQWNEDRTVRLPRTDWVNCHKIAGKFSR